jgi:hypothetical protein
MHEWKEKTQQCFDEIKRRLTSASVLRHYDPSKQVFLRCDYSDVAVEIFLLQSDDNDLHPIVFYSKVLNLMIGNTALLIKNIYRCFLPLVCTETIYWTENLLS